MKLSENINTTSNSFRLASCIACASLTLLPCPVSASTTAVLENVVEQDGVFTLAAGPKVEGIVFLQGGLWKDITIKTFHEIPWVDAASVRLGWVEFERQDQQFNWAPFDRMLDEVKKYNAAHPGAHRTLQIRVMGGRHCPKWFEASGVRYYDTTHPEAGNWETPLHAPMPYDNPEFLKQLREMYRAMYDRYHREPLVTIYHGTWSAGPWDEIFHPLGKSPLPPGYTKEKFTLGMIEQLDVLIDEFCLKNKVAELPYSGKFPDPKVIDFLGPLTQHIIERLGRRNPHLYIQSNGWGFMSGKNRSTISWGHEKDMDAIKGLVNVALQALGSNAGGNWAPQGDWIPLVQLAQVHQASYTEIYEPDFRPLDVQHHIVEAFTEKPGQQTSTNAFLPKDFIGYRPWLQQRQQILYVREGMVRLAFKSSSGVKRLENLMVDAQIPSCCTVKYRVRTRLLNSDWSEWKDFDQLATLAAGDDVEVEARMRTNDGYFTPRIKSLLPMWKLPDSLNKTLP